MKRIVVKALKKDFFSLRRGRIRALRGIDLTVDPGTFFVLVGPSGCGKSTLLNILAGIDKPTRGDVWIGKRRVVSTTTGRFVPPRRRDVAMVFQSYALYPHMTVFSNIAFPLKIAGTGTEETERRVRRVASSLGIDDILEARPAELSGGQRQRVALGRAIVRQPKVLLLDEPLSNLDALLRTSMRGELKQIQRRFAMTAVYVTHDQTEAMSLADRLAVLKDGELQQSGTPEDIYRFPANRFVAGFIGTPPMNLLEGALLRKARGPITIPGIEDVSRVQVGLRPEHLHITAEEQGVWKARLELTTSLGSEEICYLDLFGRKVLIKRTETGGLRDNQSVGIDFEREHLYVFDNRDGRRILPENH